MKLYVNVWIFRKPIFLMLFLLWLATSLAYYWWQISSLEVRENRRPLVKDQNQPKVDGSSFCETIHIAITCMKKCVLMPMLKSILHHRQNQLHFHFLVDPSTETKLSKMFDTWGLPDVKYSCYDATPHIHKVDWISNKHYSGVFALVKLVFPEILPETLQKVIVLDSDLTVLCDVEELWRLFKDMSSKQVIGLVENQSNWYLDRKEGWPALGRGYNTGVTLLNLYNLRRGTNWHKLWKSAVEDNIEKQTATQLADQDIVNTVIAKRPYLVYNVSCEYNVQMSTKTLAKGCYMENSNNVKIIHWNSPLKYRVNLPDAPFFRSIHEMYNNMDGYLFREKLYRCNHSEVVTYRRTYYLDTCASFRAAERMKLRTLLYYIDYSYTSVDSFDVTLAVQLSMDRLQFLERLVWYWSGPISAAIYLMDCDVPQFENFVKDSKTLGTRRNIGYHLVFKHSAIHYPVNYLRNVALENVNTDYIFLMDVDFIPSQGLYEHLRWVVKVVNPYAQKKVLVVPAFETQRYRERAPSTKDELVKRLKGDIAPFRAREWPRGHRATNYSLWVTADKPYEVEWQADYEPYLVVHRSVPEYDTRFSGFGWNKVSHGVELSTLGYRPLVLPEAFVLHTPHAPSQDITAFRHNMHYRVCLAQLKQEFVEDLKKKYNVTHEEIKDTVRQFKTFS